MIEVAIRVPEEFQEHPECIWRFKELSNRFNSDWFDRKQRTILTLHEGSHVHYKRLCGFDPKVYGPSVWYDGYEFWRYDASTQAMPEEIEMNEDALLVAKAIMGPVYVEEKLLGGGEHHRTFKEIWAMARGDLGAFNTLRGVIMNCQVKDDLVNRLIALNNKLNTLSPDLVYGDEERAEVQQRRENLYAEIKHHRAKGHEGKPCPAARH